MREGEEVMKRKTKRTGPLSHRTKVELIEDEEKPKRKFILCPSCNAKSKVLFSEMGGYQTRYCKNGHRFEYDKWIGDRIVMAAMFGGKIVSPYRKY